MGVGVYEVGMKADVGYPWRASLTKKARCAFCRHFVEWGDREAYSCRCEKGHSLEGKGPYAVRLHECRDYEYVPLKLDNVPKIKLNICKRCVNNIVGRCFANRIRIHPKEDRCSGFRDRRLLCRYAIPMVQGGGSLLLRSNYCKRPPGSRDGEWYTEYTWSTLCPSAHEPAAEFKRCYKPRRR